MEMLNFLSEQEIPAIWKLTQESCLEEALKRVDRALREFLPEKLPLTDPWIQVAVNLWELKGVLSLLTRRYVEAETAERTVLHLVFDKPEAAWRLGMIRAVQGDLAEGWELMEHRLRPPSHKECLGQMFPFWQGEDLQDKRILLHGEQGLGDEVQFIRYARLVWEAGAAEVGLVCQPKSARLLATALGNGPVIMSGMTIEAKDWDYHVPLMSLPRLFDTRMETIPRQTPYLFPEPSRVEGWRRRLEKRDVVGYCSWNAMPYGGVRPERTRKFRVGIAWQGSRVPQYEFLDNLRSVRLERFMPFIRETWGVVDWLSLQVGYGSEQARGFPYLADFTNEFEDLMDTACFMANLDLVISVDSINAHLAGAIGVPVWTLLPYGACWRWFLDREDSPWYPGMRLFRQPVVKDWDSVFRRVGEELQRKVALWSTNSLAI